MHNVISISIAALLSFTMVARAATIVQWGVSGDGDTDIVTSNANGIYTDLYSNNYVSPANDTNGYLTSVSGQSRNYYGAMDHSGGIFGINNLNSGDVIQMVKSLSGAGGTVTSMIAWESPDFLTSDTQLESFNMEFDTRGGITTGSYLLETGDGWYISNETLAGCNVTTNTKSIDDLTWSSFGLFGLTGGGVIPADTSNPVSVGAYFTSTLEEGNWTGAKLRYFEVTAVPEPRTYALLGGFFALTYVMVRHRHV